MSTELPPIDGLHSQTPNPEPRPSAVLLKYLEQHTEFTAASSVDAPAVIMQLIGGARVTGISIETQVVDEDRRADDTGLHNIQLKDLAVSSGGLYSFSQLLGEAEKDADNNYIYALERARDLIAERQKRGHETDLLLMPGNVSEGARNVEIRLQRLAQ